MNLLRSLIENYENHKDFKKGGNLQHIYYGKALCSALLDNNYNMSLEYCYKGILKEYPSFTIDNISDNIYSNVGITKISNNTTELTELESLMRADFSKLLT